MASSNNLSSASPTFRHTYSRRRKQLQAFAAVPRTVEHKFPKMKKFSAAWWAEVRALGASRRAIFFGPLTRAGNYEDDEPEEVHARISEIAVTEPQQGNINLEDPVLSNLRGTNLAKTTQETKNRELRYKRRADNLQTPPRGHSREEIRNVSLELLAAMALEEEQNQAGPSDPVTRREGNEPVVSEDEDSFWEDYGHFFAEQDFKEEEDIDVERLNRAEYEDEVEEYEELQLRNAKMQVPQRVTRSALKRKTTSTTVVGVVAKKSKEGNHNRL